MASTLAGRAVGVAGLPARHGCDDRNRGSGGAVAVGAIRRPKPVGTEHYDRGDCGVARAHSDPDSAVRSEARRSRSYRPGDRMGRAARALICALAAVAAALAATIPALADDFGTHLAGQHVYDRAGVLSAAQVAGIESQAAGLDQAGTPTIVYVRRKAADDLATRQDARDLMDAWQVESSPGAKDGMVVLLNLK